MILLSGFEPFDGDAANPSWGAVRVAGDMMTADSLYF